MSSATFIGDLAGSTASAPPPPNESSNALEVAQSHFELGIALLLHGWPALTLAVQNSWGGPDSSDKRDWFGGEIVNLFHTRPDTDLEDVESVLLQVMQDEFDVVVDDESAFEVAEGVMRIRTHCGRGDFTEVLKMREKWQAKGGGDVTSNFQKIDRNEEDDETDGSEFEGFSDDDVEMGDASVQAAPKEKNEPEVDEDGFTKVVGKKKR